MLIDHNREKLLNAIIYFLKETKFCGKTKLVKLLYFLDFFHYKETGKSITGLDYFAWKFGPYPVSLGKEIDEQNTDLIEYISIKKDKDFTNLQPKKKFNKEYFSKRELRILENVAFIFKEAKTDDMVEISHLKNQPWYKTLTEKGQMKKIDYDLAFEDNVLIDIIKENIADRKKIEKACT